jgi:hypothetical protein
VEKENGKSPYFCFPFSTQDYISSVGTAVPSGEIRAGEPHHAEYEPHHGRDGAPDQRPLGDGFLEVNPCSREAADA